MRFLVLLMCASPLAAQTVDTVAIARSGETPGGGMATFTANFVGGFAANYAAETAFLGTTTDGLALWRGTSLASLIPIATTSTPLPGSPGDTFLDFGTNMAFGNGTVYLPAANATSSPTVQGIYGITGVGVGSVVANTSTPVPGGLLGNFTGFSLSQILNNSGDNVAFRGTYTGGSGLFARVGGSLTTIITTASAIPGGTGNFSAPSANTSISGGLVSFRGSGSSSQQGIYFRDLTNNGPTLRVLDKNSILPGTDTTLVTGMNEPNISGSVIRVAVTAGTGTQRIAQFVWNGSNTMPAFAESVLYRVGDNIPGMSGLTFSGFGGFIPSDGDKFAFIGNYNDGSTKNNLFFFDGETTHLIVGQNQFFDQGIVNNILLGADAVQGNTLTYSLVFGSGTTAPRGVYTTTITPVPEPLLALLGGAVAIGRIRRK